MSTSSNARRDNRRRRPGPAPVAMSSGGRVVAPTIHGSNPIPVRALLAVAGTLLGLALLFSFRTPDAVTPTADPSRPVTAVGAGSRRTPGAAAVPPTPAATAAPGAAATPASPIGRTSTTVPSATTRPAPATLAPTARPASGDVTGPVERTPYGDVQVEVKLNAGQIVDVIALQLPNDRRRSAEISQYVEPILHEEALQAQSAAIDLISGATWTSGAYQASLQTALQQAGVS